MDVGRLAERVALRQAGSPPSETARMAILRPAYPADLSRRSLGGEGGGMNEGDLTSSVSGHFFGQTLSSDPTTGLKKFQETGPAAWNFRNPVVGTRAISAG